MKITKKEIILLFVGLYILTIPILISDKDSVSFSMLAGVIIIAITLFHKDIESISILTWLKIKLNKKINEAEEIIRNMRLLASLSVEHGLTDLMAGCFSLQGGINRYKRFELKDEKIKTLANMGFSDTEINQIEKRSQWKNGVRMIYWNAIEHTLERCTKKGEINPKESERRKVSKLISKTMNVGENSFTEWKTPTPEEMEKIIKDNKIEIDEKLQGWLNDYKNYLATGKINRKEDLLKGNY